MPKNMERKPRTHTIDKLRARVWFFQVMKLSGKMSPHALWRYVEEEAIRLNLDKAKISRASWYNYRNGTVPKNNVVSIIEILVPGTAAIFNALFWSILKGIPVSQEEVFKELNLISERYTGQHKLMHLDFWMSAVERDPEQFEIPAVQTIFESRTGEDFLQLTVLILSLSDKIGNTELWNYMCRTYRKFLPLYIPNIPWPLKNEIFDELDKYIKERKHSGLRRKSNKKDWRDSMPDVHDYVKDEYTHILNIAFLNYPINYEFLPEEFTQKLAEILATEFCKSENQMLYSWLLCDSISLDVAETIADIQSYGDGKITIERIIRYIKSIGYFNLSCPGYESYAKFEKLRKYHLNFCP